MKPKTYQADLALLLATLFWGSSFIPVKSLVATIPPYELLTLRFGIMGILLAPFVIPKVIRNYRAPLVADSKPRQDGVKTLFSAALLLGVLLFAGFAFQTIGMKYTTATNAAFVTGLNVVFVPILLSLLGHHKPSIQLWGCVIIAIVGLGIFSLTETLHINYGDFLVFFCALIFAFHVIYTSRFTVRFSPVELACIQFILVFIVGFIFTWLLERDILILPSLSGWMNILYLALFATGASLLLQAYFQRYTETTRAALIYVMEPVFAAFLGFLILHEHLNGRQWVGAILILAAMVFSEMRIGKKENG